MAAPDAGVAKAARIKKIKPLFTSVLCTRLTDSCLTMGTETSGRARLHGPAQKSLHHAGSAKHSAVKLPARTISIRQREGIEPVVGKASRLLTRRFGGERPSRHTARAIPERTEFLFFRIDKGCLKTGSRDGEIVAAMTLEAFEVGAIKPEPGTA